MSNTHCQVVVPLLVVFIDPSPCFAQTRPEKANFRIARVTPRRSVGISISIHATSLEQTPSSHRLTDNANCDFHLSRWGRFRVCRCNADQIFSVKRNLTQWPLTEIVFGSFNGGPGGLPVRQKYGQN